LRIEIIDRKSLLEASATGGGVKIVPKSQTEEATNVEIEPLEKQGTTRIEELSNMLGDRHAASDLTHARELLGKCVIF
jgi:DNA repair ATPase RecN